MAYSRNAFIETRERQERERQERDQRKTRERLERDGATNDGLAYMNKIAREKGELERHRKKIWSYLDNLMTN